MLTRILMKYLEGTGNVTLLHRCKSVIRDSTRRYRLGDESVAPLHDAIEGRLEIMVDDRIWNRVKMCLEMYLNQEQGKKPTPTRNDPPGATNLTSATLSQLYSHRVAI